MTDIVLPQLGETIHEGTIVRWFKGIGDRVERDEPLYEISTEKVDSEVPSPTAGVLAKIVAAAGEVVQVGDVLAVLADEGSGELNAGSSEGDEASASASAALLPGEAEVSALRAPDAPAAAVDAAEVEAAAAGAEMRKPDIEPRLMSPLVRRLVNKFNLDLTGIVGSGVGGRITREDAESLIRQQSPSEASLGSRLEPSGSSGDPRTDSAGGRGDSTEDSPDEPKVIRLSRIRRSIGAHMVSSKASAPHVLTAMEVDFEMVERARQPARASWRAREGFSLTYLPFIARALCDSLLSYPHINASIDGDELIIHDAVHLAIAVDLDFQGLIAPVLRNAEGKRLRVLAREIHDLARRARGKELSPSEASGGTFTVTNPGQYGTLMQFPIINQPQVAILSTDGVRRKPVVVTAPDGTEAVGIHSVGVLALAWDHRAFDGAYAAAFLKHLRNIIETRDWQAEIT